jgi:hypothetical protein
MGDNTGLLDDLLAGLFEQVSLPEGWLELPLLSHFREGDREIHSLTFLPSQRGRCRSSECSFCVLFKNYCGS